MQINQSQAPNLNPQQAALLSSIQQDPSQLTSMLDSIAGNPMIAAQMGQQNLDMLKNLTQ